MGSRRRDVLYLPLSLLRTGRPEKPGNLRELAEDLRHHGMFQPLTVQKTGEQYQVISGKRRALAARIAGLDLVPCLMALPGQENPAVTALREQLHREDIHFFQEAELMREFLRRSGMSRKNAAAALGRSSSAIANKLRLGRLSPALQQELQNLGLTERHVRALLPLGEERDILAAAREVAAAGRSACGTEAWVREKLTQKKCASE